MLLIPMALQLSLVLQPANMCMQRFVPVQGRGATSVFMEHDSAADLSMAILNRPSGMPIKLVELGGAELTAKWKELKFDQRNALKHAAGSNGDEEEAKQMIAEILGK